MRTPLLLLLTPLLLGAGPTTEPSTAPSTTQSAAATPRPAHDRDPWIFRCVLDGNARMVVISLGHDVWAAYDVNRCRFAKLWTGKVEFTGPVFDTRHGPQPKSNGTMLLNRPARLVPNPPATTAPTAAEYSGWRGYRVAGDRATLQFDLSGVQIEETPTLSAADEQAHTVTLRREIKLTAGGGGVRLPMVFELPTSSAVRSIKLVDGEAATIGGDKSMSPGDLQFDPSKNLRIRVSKSGTIVLETTLSTE